MSIVPVSIRFLLTLSTVLWLVGGVPSTLYGMGGISASFLETFGEGTYDHEPWYPMNAESSLTLLSTSSDRDQMDASDDGALLIKRGGTATGQYGAIRSLGIVDASDVGHSLIIDFAYEQPNDGFSGLRPRLLVDGDVAAEGSGISLFSSGNDPGAANGLYSGVRTPLIYMVNAHDVGKEMILIIQFYDGNVNQNRDLVLDAVNVINTRDAPHMPPLAINFSDVDGSPASELTYTRRINRLLPGMNYVMETSDDLNFSSIPQTEPDETSTDVLNDNYEQVTERFRIGSDERKFYRLNVRTKRIGDPGMRFDEDKLDPNYPQMQIWQTAGVQGGIPFRSAYPVLRVLTATDSAGISDAIDAISGRAASMGGGAIYLRDGDYTIDARIVMRDYVRLIGESREGVVLNVTITTPTDPQGFDQAFRFERIEYAGLDNLTIKGAYGTPDPSLMENAKGEFLVASVNFTHARNCWLDDVNIIDSGNHPITNWRSSHVTIRGCYIDGAWNKGSGGRGYFQIQADRNLIVNNHVGNLRHIVLQSEHCEYNVVVYNFFEQDVNFHNDDNGNNLVEGNRIILPTTLGSGWRPIMGPWASFHSISRKDNYVFNNKCVELNNGGRVSFSDTSKVYLGSRNREQAGNVFVESSLVPARGTFYPVILSP
jgi:hypothetical protein